uniref:Ovule protein n=1 Tax=Steinernema glaseri TaxID=37863 RepID=A0A1I7YH34_9BILA
MLPHLYIVKKDEQRGHSSITYTSICQPHLLLAPSFHRSALLENDIQRIPNQRAAIQPSTDLPSKNRQEIKHCNMFLLLNLSLLYCMHLSACIVGLRGVMPSIQEVNGYCLLFYDVGLLFVEQPIVSVSVSKS